MEGTANEAGSGLGMLISKDYSERNGGTIKIESEPGKGSVFTRCFLFRGTSWFSLLTLL